MKMVPDFSPPCKDCERKGCGTYHDECQIYLEWKEKKKAIVEQLRNEKRLYTTGREKRRRRY